MINLEHLDKFYLDDFVKDIFIGMLQQIFYQNPNEFHWDPDESLTKLNITDQFNTDNLTPDFKPTIYIRRRPLGFLNTSIDQFLGGSYNTSKKYYTDLISGIVELVSVSREGLEAGRLAGLTFLLINEFVGEFRKMGMHDVSVKALGEEEPKDVKTTMRVVEVPVTVQYIFQYTWAVQTMGLMPLREVEIGRTTEATTGAQLKGKPSTVCSPTGAVAIGCAACEAAATMEICTPCIPDPNNVNICIPMTADTPLQVPDPCARIELPVRLYTGCLCRRE